MTWSIPISRRVCLRLKRSQTQMHTIVKLLSTLRTNMFIENGPIMMTGVMILHGSTRISLKNLKNMSPIIKNIFSQGVRQKSRSKEPRRQKILAMENMNKFLRRKRRKGSRPHRRAAQELFLQKGPIKKKKQKKSIS